MSKLTIVGIAADAIGFSMGRDHWMDERGRAHRRIEFAAVPASCYHTTLPRIPMDWRHGRQIGEIVHLERDGHLTVVAELDIDRCFDLDLFDGPMFLSPETWEERFRDGVRAELMSVAITPTPAGVGLRPIRIHGGSLEAVARRATGHQRGLLERAVQARRRRQYGDPLRIIDQPNGVERHIERSADGTAFLHGERIPERRTSPALSDEAKRIGIRQIEHSVHRGRIISVR